MVTGYKTKKNTQRRMHEKTSSSTQGRDGWTGIVD